MLRKLSMTNGKGGVAYDVLYSLYWRPSGRVNPVGSPAWRTGRYGSTAQARLNLKPAFPKPTK